MTISKKQYLWVRDDQNLPPQIIKDLDALYRNSQYDPKIDKIYEVGPEVKLEMTLNVIPVKPVTRDSASGYQADR